MPDYVREVEAQREGDCTDCREQLRLARRCVSPFEDGEESSYTQTEALRDLENWLRAQSPRRESR